MHAQHGFLNHLPQLVARYRKHHIHFRRIDSTNSDWNHVRRLIQNVYIDELSFEVTADKDVYDDASEVYLALCGDQVVATARCIDYRRLQALHLDQQYTTRHGRRMLPMEHYFSLHDYLDSDQVIECGRLIVSPAYRRQGLVLGFMALFYLYARRHGIRKAFSLCNYSVPATINTYLKVGWQALAEPFQISQCKVKGLPLAIRSDALNPAFVSA